MAGVAMRRPVLLLSCGCFNPITNMHLRLFELARDSLRKTEKYEVIGGIIMPTHDKYGKKDLIEATHRLHMCRLAVKSSNWIRVDDWETKQDTWTETLKAMQHAYDMVADGKSPYDWSSQACSWNAADVQVKLICGADLLESFAIPGLWKEEHMKSIVSASFGLVVITRMGSNPEKFIASMNLLQENRDNILIVEECIPNEVSSTKIRQAVRNQDSIRYLTPDAVVDYIKENGLYELKA